MVKTPGTEFEQRLWDSGCRRVAGVDEVGLGPLAGPVVAAACVLPVGAVPIAGVRDSKTLSPRQRENLAVEIAGHALAVGLGAASVREIEEMNVLAASRLAMRRALKRISRFDHVLVDGRPIRGWSLGPYTPIVDGDALVYSISCASIVAKVARDRLMTRLAQRYPGYEWESNFGYGTAGHMAGIRQLGLTPHHRRCFEPVRQYCQPDLFSGVPDSCPGLF